ncbi:MAG: AAA family ATPase [Bacteroidota bacterium]
MIIKKIVLNNFRVYHGINELNFSSDEMHNVSVVAGNNGYGKTSFLTSLVWCLYGKLMADVDDRYRKEIYESGGYKKYCGKIMNWRALNECDALVQQLKEKRTKVNAIEMRQIDKEIARLQSFGVSIVLVSYLFLPCLAMKLLYAVPITHTHIMKKWKF